MRRVLGMLFILILATALACGVATPQASITPAPSSPATPQPRRTPTATLAASPTLAATPTLATPAPSALALSPSAPPTLSPASFAVRIHPDDALYVGDQISFEIVALSPTDLGERYATVLPDAPDGIAPLQARFERFGIQGRQQATLVWAWDTRGLPAGDYTLTFSIQPDGTTWTQTITLLPQSELPWPASAAEWATAASECCALHYITNTPAERDLPELLLQADEQAHRAAQSMGVQFSEPITITLMPRVLGHGGFASNEIHISYLDRNYAGSTFALVLHHEMIHILDYRLGGDYRPSLFQEGLAVYLTGGHFKTEPILPRAAALLQLGDAPNGWYIPLQTLADDFYPAQHETGYLEGAALIEYMVNRWGWPAFLAFYRDIHPAPGHGPPSLAISIALQTHFGLSFEQLEQDFLAALRQEPPNPALQDDLRLTVAYYDSVRRYQKALDPSAYYMTAWLADSREMRQRNITADFLRHPAAPANLTLETLLITADETLRSGRFGETEIALQAVNAVLDAIEQGEANPLAAHPLAADYASIGSTLLAEGYQPERITVYGDTAQAWVTQDSVQMMVLDLKRGSHEWVIAKTASSLLTARKQNGAISCSDSPWFALMEWMFSTRKAGLYTTGNWHQYTKPPEPKR